MCFGPFSPFTILLLFIQVYWYIDQFVWDILDTPRRCLTLMFLKKYFRKPLSILKWHLICSWNHATIALYSNYIWISMVLFQSSFLGTIVNTFSQSPKKQQQRVFHWNQLSSIITLYVISWWSDVKWVLANKFDTSFNLHKTIFLLFPYMGYVDWQMLLTCA